MDSYSSGFPMYPPQEEFPNFASQQPQFPMSSPSMGPPVFSTDKRQAAIDLSNYLSTREPTQAMLDAETEKIRRRNLGIQTAPNSTIPVNYLTADSVGSMLDFNRLTPAEIAEQKRRDAYHALSPTPQDAKNIAYDPKTNTYTNVLGTMNKGQMGRLEFPYLAQNADLPTLSAQARQAAAAKKAAAQKTKEDPKLSNDIQKQQADWLQNANNPEIYKAAGQQFAMEDMAQGIANREARGEFSPFKGPVKKKSLSVPDAQQPILPSETRQAKQNLMNRSIEGGLGLFHGGETNLANKIPKESILRKSEIMGKSSFTGKEDVRDYLVARGVAPRHIERIINELSSRPPRPSLGGLIPQNTSSVLYEGRSLIPANDPYNPMMNPLDIGQFVANAEPKLGVTKAEVEALISKLKGQK